MADEYLLSITDIDNKFAKGKIDIELADSNGDSMRYKPVY